MPSPKPDPVDAHSRGEHIHIKHEECKLCLEEAYHRFMTAVLEPVALSD